MSTKMKPGMSQTQRDRHNRAWESVGKERARLEATIAAQSAELERLREVEQAANMVMKSRENFDYVYSVEMKTAMEALAAALKARGE